MKLFNNLPIFSITLGELSEIDTISLVNAPAVESTFLAFGKEEKKQEFQIVDEVKHNLMACLVRVDYPIFRLTESGEGYYVTFSKEVSQELCRRLLKGDCIQNLSLNHNGQPITGVSVQEVFLKDSSKGINPYGFESIGDGSLMIILHVEDLELWNRCLSGEFTGVSLEAYLGIEEQFQKQFNRKNKMSKIKESIKKLLLQFGEVETNKGILTYEEEGELQVGYNVYINEEPAADGEYEVNDKIFVVVDGKVSEIKDVMPTVEETAMAEMPTVEVPAEEPAVDPYEERIKALEDEVKTLKEMVDALKEEIMKPAAEPVEEEFEKVTEREDIKDVKLQRAIAYAKALRQ